jgi:glycerol-3-phosphate cytidylyltransferase
MGWPAGKKKPDFIIHSSNCFAAQKMKYLLAENGFRVGIQPFECVERYQRKVGILAGAFDILHPGYIELFRDAKKNACNYLIVAIHEDPTFSNPAKLPVVFTANERMRILASIVYIDELLKYQSEGDLLDLMEREKPDVIIVGSDHRGGGITGASLKIPIYYHERTHDFSETALKIAICNRIEKGSKR